MNSRVHTPRLSVLLGAVGLLTAATADARTVAIAPFVTSSGPEYRWVGIAIADALSLRVHQQDDLDALTLRQVNAAMRQDNVRETDLGDLTTAVALGRQLGADILVTGSYTAAWPDAEFIVRILDVPRAEVLSSSVLAGGLDQLMDLEARAARALALQLGADSPDVTPGAFGTDHVRAWRSATLGLDLLNWQSLAPAAADINATLRLAPEALAEATRHLSDATSLDPDFGEAWAGLGVAQALTGDTTMAWRSFAKATALGFGHHPTAVLGAAFVRMREGRWDDAAEILASAIRRHPGFLHARGYLGQLYNHLGRQREALATWNAYAERVPRQPWVLAQRGYTKSKLKDHAGAIADSIAAVDLLPNSPSILLELASRYIDAGKLVGAQDALEHALEAFPANSTILVRLGYVYLQQGNDALAIPITEKALGQGNFAGNPRNLAYAHLNLARAHGRQGNLDRAFTHLGKARAASNVSLDELLADPKLTKLRADPRFKALSGS